MPKYKLRRIVGTTAINRRGLESDRDVLECGHVVRITKDFYGEVWAERRRCFWCITNEPPHVENVIVDGKLRFYQLTDEAARRVAKAKANDTGITAVIGADRSVVRG